MKGPHRALAAAAAMLVSIACCAGELDAEGLERSIRDLRSAAEESQSLLTLANRGDVTERYARVQREELAKLVREAAKPLDDPAPERLTPRAMRAKGLSTRLAEGLDKEDAIAVRSAAQGLHELAKGTR